MYKQIPEWIVFHVPHDSTWIPDEVRPQFSITDSALADEVLKMTDHHTLDLLTKGIPQNQIICSKVSRLVVDVERFPNDVEESMSAVGMGVIYTRRHNGEILRDALPEYQRDTLLAEWYYPHHDELADKVDSVLERCGKCLLIDCHSFPTAPLPYELDKSPQRPQFCIGTDEFHTPDDLAKSLVRGIERMGFSAKENTPFSGALVPLRHYRKDKRVSSVMIEVRRDIYMNEHTAEKLAGFSSLSSKIQDIVVDCSQRF